MKRGEDGEEVPLIEGETMSGKSRLEILDMETGSMTVSNVVSVSPPIQIIVETPTHYIEPVETRDPVVETAPNEVHQGSQVQNVAITTPVRRSTRERRSAIPPDYLVYIGEQDYDIGSVTDPITYEEAVSCPQSELWLDAMRDEIQSMRHNGVWELNELP